MIRGKKFYQQGLRFRCIGDGKCCLSRGKYGYVYLSFNDRKRLAAHLKISTREFTEGYTEKEDGLYQLKYTGRDCPFLNGTLCLVYDARPWQCRTWPFWPENMNEAVWQEVLSYCPGAGHGRLYTAEDIEAILAKKTDVAGVAKAAGQDRRRKFPSRKKLISPQDT